MNSTMAMASARVHFEDLPGSSPSDHFEQAFYHDGIDPLQDFQAHCMQGVGIFNTFPLPFNTLSTENLDFLDLSASNFTPDSNPDLSHLFALGVPTPGGTLTCPMPANGQLDPSLILPNKQGHFQQFQYATAPNMFERQQDFTRPLFTHAEIAQSAGQSTLLTNGQVTPPQTLSPTTSEHADSSSASPGNAKVKTSKRKASVHTEDPARPAVEGPPKAKRGRKSKKHKLQSEAEKQAQRERFLERNRNAAAKCRTNKKQWQEDLKDNVKNLSQIHAHLTHEYATLQNEYDQLRSTLLRHSRICQHDDLRDWADNRSSNTFPIALTPGSVVALNNQEGQEDDPAIARKNADYTDKRVITMPDSNPLLHYDRRHSLPTTPSASEIKLERRRLKSLAEASRTPIGERLMLDGMHAHRNCHAQSPFSQSDLTYFDQIH